MKNLGKYSIGIGDRFAMEGIPQLRAFLLAADRGLEITPVWNKSHREHLITGTAPGDTRREADEAVRGIGWKGPYFVDADHIGSGTVEGFISSSDFFTIDVAEFIGREAPPAAVAEFIAAMRGHAGRHDVPGLEEPLLLDGDLLRSVASRYIAAVEEAGRVYRKILSGRNGRDFVTEVSLDESQSPQSPGELYFILGAIAAEGIPLGTIAPKFSGAFFKGIDYVGDADAFAREFERDLAVVAFASRRFGLPSGLKLSVHTGSDKFSLYPLMHRALRRLDAGLHLKTAGTTWLEELVTLAEAGGEGLIAAKKIYAASYERYDELCAPYAQVISIDRSKLPAPAAAEAWTAEEFAGVFRHDPAHPLFNPHGRQLLHVGYRVAAEMGSEFGALVRRHAGPIGSSVTHNIFHRHILPLFLGAENPD